MGFWDFFALLIWSFLFVMYLMVLFHIFGDLFRDPELGGGAKALWTIGLILLPFLLMLIYLIVRGRGMAERQAGAIRQAQTETDLYIKSVAGSSSPADQISSAKTLLDSGSITRRVRPAEGHGTRLTEGSAAWLDLGGETSAQGWLARSPSRQRPISILPRRESAVGDGSNGAVRPCRW